MKAFEEFIPDDMINRFTIAQLLDLIENLNNVASAIEDKFNKRGRDMDNFEYRKTQDELFYVYGNISNLEDQLIVETKNIFHETPYAEICNN